MYRTFLAQRYLRSRLVNLIAVGGVMFGVAVLIVVTSVMDGFRAKVLEVLRGNLSDIVMTPLVPPGEPLPLYERMDQELRKDKRVQATSIQVSVPVFFLYPAAGRGQHVFEDRAVHQMVAVGIDFERETRVSKIAEYLVVANDPEDPFHSERAIDYEKSGTVLISRTFAEKFLGLGRLFLDPRDLLEQDVQVTFLEVAGSSEGGRDGNWSMRALNMPTSAVYDAEDTSLDIGRLYMDIDVLRDVGKIDDEYHVIRVKLKDPEDAPAVQNDFRRRYPGFAVTVWQDHRRQYLRAVNNEKVLLVIVLSFIVLLGGFIILATLTLTVVEKTKDIGVLAALGANRRGILSLFVGTALLIGVVGALLGIGLGWLFTNNVNGIKDFLADRMGVQIFPSDIYLFREIPTIWDWPSILWIAGGSIFMAFVAGLIPALRAARMDPVKALRYE